MNEKDRLQRQQAEHSAHIAEARAAEAEAQAEAAASRAAAARAANREDEKEELLRDFADQVRYVLDGFPPVFESQPPSFTEHSYVYSKTAASSQRNHPPPPLKTLFWQLFRTILRKTCRFKN